MSEPEGQAGGLSEENENMEVDTEASPEGSNAEGQSGGEEGQGENTEGAAGGGYDENSNFSQLDEGAWSAKLPAGLEAMKQSLMKVGVLDPEPSPSSSSLENSEVAEEEPKQEEKKEGKVKKVWKEPELDIWGNPLNRKLTFKVDCPVCKMTMDAIRFTNHLANCMGLGRTRSRRSNQQNAGESCTSAEKSSQSSGGK